MDNKEKELYPTGNNWLDILPGLIVGVLIVFFLLTIVKVWGVI